MLRPPHRALPSTWSWRSAPGFKADSSDDANRLYQSRTPAYRWLVANAAPLRLRQLRLRAVALGVDRGSAVDLAPAPQDRLAGGAASATTAEAHPRAGAHLIPLGVGAIVGTGIYTLIGVGANLAGPAVMLSFLIAGAVCACAALAYAEVATMIPASGSAYTYSYVVLGEIIAWVVGWSLILEYSLVVSAVAVGWSGYAVGFLGAIGRAPADGAERRARTPAGSSTCRPSPSSPSWPAC